MSAISGPRKTSVASASAAVKSSAHCVRAPALRLTAVWVVPPPHGMAPANAPASEAAPVASSSRFAPGRASPCPVKARPAAIDSVKLMRAMPAAAGHSASARSRRGRSNASPPCTSPTVSTPIAFRPRSAEAAIASAMPMSGAGARGAQRRPARMIARTASPVANVASDSCGSSRPIATRSRKKPALAMWMPSSLDSWSVTITSPMPALNPTSTGWDMKLATKPMRRNAASTSIAPASRASVPATTVACSGPAPRAASPIAVATRIAIVLVVETLSTRELPSRAYAAMGTTAVHRPACTGSPAMVAWAMAIGTTTAPAVRPASASARNAARS